MIRYKKTEILLYLWLLFTIFISGLMLLFSSSIYVDIFAFIFLVVNSFVIVKFDLSHPFVWFSFIFMLYSLAYPILYLFGATYDIYDYSKSLIFSEWLALATFLLIVTPKKVDYSRLINQRKDLFSSNYIIHIVTIFVLITTFQVSSGGFQDKTAIYGEGSFFTLLGFRAALILIVIYSITLSIYVLKYQKLNLKLVTYIFLVTFSISFISGERDFLIRFIVVSAFIYYILIKKTKLTMETILIGILGLTLIPVLNTFKYYGLTGEINTSQENFIVQFLTSDFMSASKNMQILLLDNTSKGIFHGESIISAIFRALSIDKLFGLELLSSSQWFNDYYFGPKRAGQGFTLVGDGYLNFGYLGIIIVFVLIGIIVKILYLKSNYNVYFFVYYILSIPVFMYAIRSDLANILVPLVKQNLITILFVVFIALIIRNIKNPNISLERSFNGIKRIYRN